MEKMMEKMMENQMQKKTPSFCGVFFNSKSEENATILEGGKNGGKSNVKKMPPFCRSCKENIRVLNPNKNPNKNPNIPNVKKMLGF